jgi:hypothetical protein
MPVPSPAHADALMADAEPAYIDVATVPPPGSNNGMAVAATTQRLTLTRLRRDCPYWLFTREHPALLPPEVQGRLCTSLAPNGLPVPAPLGAFYFIGKVWTQPAPPVIVGMSECRAGVVELHWGVRDKRDVSRLLRGAEIPPGYMYRLEVGVPSSGASLILPHSGLRSSDDPTAPSQHAESAVMIEGAMRWEVAGVSDAPNLRFRLLPAATLGTSGTAQRRAMRRCLQRCFFRVRLAKVFSASSADPSAPRQPVWGAPSLPVRWDPPAPPGVVIKPQLHYASHDAVVVVGRIGAPRDAVQHLTRYGSSHA